MSNNSNQSIWLGGPEIPTSQKPEVNRMFMSEGWLVDINIKGVITSVVDNKSHGSMGRQSRPFIFF